MIDLQKLKQAAKESLSLQGTSKLWYCAYDIINGMDYSKDAEHLANCDPTTILKLIEVVRAAQNVVQFTDDHYYTSGNLKKHWKESSHDHRSNRHAIRLPARVRCPLE